MEDGSVYLDFRIINSLSISLEYIEKEKIKQMSEIKRRTLLYRNTYTMLKKSEKINSEDLTVILVDDGASTGATIISVVRWIKNNHCHKYKKLLVAVPVVPKKTVELLNTECDHLISIFQTSTFRTVSHYYKQFLQITDQQVVDIITKWTNYY